MSQPTANNSPVSSLAMSACGIIFNEKGHILLIKENYDRRRYGLPGGMIEAGETPEEAVIREVMEETCVQVRVSRLVGMYDFRWSERWLSFAFLCEIESGSPTIPPTDEIAEVSWFDPHDLPTPLTNVAPLAIADALREEYGIVRHILPR